MRKNLQLTLFILLFSFSKLIAQPCDFTYSEFPVGAPHCQGITLIFSDASTGATTWDWDFGAGAVPQFSTQQNPGIINFPVCNANQQVTLIINGGACTHTETVPIWCNPTACFTNFPTTACAGAPVQFTNCSTPGPGGTSLSFQWDLGNGAPGITSVNPNYTYPEDSGCFNVGLLVTNNHGCTNFIQHNNAICFTPPPTFVITSTSTTTCQQTLLVNFCDSAITGGSPPYSYSWTFQGGTPATSSIQCPTGISFPSGQWDVSCTVTDNFGCASTITIPNDINVGNNSTSIILSDDTVCVGECVTVGTGPSSSYSWTIAPTVCVLPAGVQTAASVNYCFSCPGTYTITLNSVVNGCAVSAVTTVHVFAKPVACINLSSNPPSCSYPQTVNVQYCGIGGPWTYLWQFPGGTPATSTQQNPGNITYNSCGHFGITLTVTGAGGCDSTIYLGDTVKIDCPVACYTVTDLPDEGEFCAPLTLTYNAGCSTGSPTQYLWCVQPVGLPPCIATQNLGPTPTLNFPVAGCYNVTLKIVNALGCKDSITNSFPGTPICVGEHSAPCFTATPLNTCAPVPVNFFNCTPDSLGVPGGDGWLSCHSWCWNFGDGGGCQSTLAEPEHPYQDTGCFDVMLISKNCGCYDTLLITEYVCIYPPIPHLLFTVNCDSPNFVNYDATTAVGADSIIWSFPNGIPSTSNSPLVTVEYPMPNPNSTQVAVLKICNFASGCCDSTGVQVFLRNLQGIATVDTVVCFPQTSPVTNTSIGAQQYVWRVYNSCANGALIPSMNSTGNSWNTFTNAGAITWPGPGKYFVRLRVIASSGCEDTLEWNVKVYGVSPQFYGDNLSGCAPLTVNFTDTTQSNCISSPVSHVYNFGDGSVSGSSPIGTVVTHTYLTSGSFSVSDTVTDNHGCKSVTTYTAYVNTLGPDAQFSVADTAICLGTTECFFNNSSGINYTSVWYFGDGTTSIQSAPCHTYLNSGFYTVKLVITDANGCKDSLTKFNYIFVGQVDVDFYASDTLKSCPFLAVDFTVSPTIPDSCGKFYWSFGDGAHSQIENPFHIYGFSGAFTVSLFAIDTCLGCSTTVTKISYINLGGPFSNPVATPDTSCLPQLICFDLAPTNSVSFLWDFDDGSPLVAGTSSICHLYAMPDTGMFFPSVVLTDSSLTCTYTRIVDTLILVQPIAKFTSSTNDLCSNGTVTFTDNSWSFGGINVSGAPINNIVNYLWDFGDTSTPFNGANPPPHTYNTFGDFVVSLTITSVGGCTNTFLDTIHVTEAPTAVPVVPASSMCLGTCTQFTADTSGSSSVCSVLWDFGDPSTTLDVSGSFDTCYTYPAPGIYNVSLIVYGCNGCNDTSATSVEITPPPVADAGADAINCTDSITVLNGTGGVDFLWSTGETTSSISVSAVINTTYYLTVTDANGCTDSDSAVVTITPPPTASISPGDSVCPGSSITLTASGGTTYHWNTGETTASIVVTADTSNAILIYTVTAYVGTCGDDTSVTITVLPFPPVDAGDSAEFCFGLSTQLNGTTTASVFLWQPSASLSDSTILNPIASPTVTTTYTLTVTDANGCTNSDVLVITVHPLPILDAGPDKKICSDTYTQLSVTGAVFYSWSPSFGLLNNSVSNPICGGLNFDTTTYTITGTDIYGCQGFDTITVFVLFPFTVQYPNDTCFCYGESAKLCAVSSTQSTYRWKPINGLDSIYSACVDANPLITTTYTIYVSDSLGCYADTGNVVVCIYPLPTVIAGPDATILVGTTTQLSGYNSTTPGTGNYQWLPDSTLTCYGCENPIADPLISTMYIVTLTDLNGCKDEDTTMVNVFCNDNVLFVPNAFTPNNDGKNDEFHLDGVGISELHFLRIYNRWGQLIFETNDFNAKWDGRINGKKSEPEVFDYFLEAVCSTGELIRKQGNITLIR